jgi:class 3 adenylate cyclase
VTTAPDAPSPSRWSRLLDAADSPGAAGRDPAEQRRVRLCNQTSAIGIATCASFVVGYLAADARAYWTGALANGLAVVAFAGAIALNARGHHRAARVALLAPAHCLILAVSALVGSRADFHLYFFVFAALGFLLFPEGERWERRAFAALSVASFAAVEEFVTPRGAFGFSGEVMRALRLTGVGLSFGTLIFLVRLFRADVHSAEDALTREHARSERLLLNILPASVSERLKGGDKNIAEGFASVTVLFADLVGFTELSARLSPKDLVQVLNRIFSEFDGLAQRYGVEKIKTIGDAYMVACGLPEERPDHAEVIAELALEMRVTLARVSAETGHPLLARIGINTGPVVAGVIGRQKFIYDLWGDAVNTASRMESHGIPGEIQVTEAVHARLADRYELTSRGTITVKGKGEMPTWLLVGRKPPMA